MSTLSSVPEDKKQMYPFKFEGFDDIEKELVSMLKQHALADPSIFFSRTDAQFNIIATSIIERIRAAESRETKAIINQQIKSVLDELEKHIGDVHMERVGVAEMDSLTPGREVERQHFKQTIQKIRSRYE